MDIGLGARVILSHGALGRAGGLTCPDLIPVLVEIFEIPHVQNINVVIKIDAAQIGSDSCWKIFIATVNPQIDAPILSQIDRPRCTLLHFYHLKIRWRAFYNRRSGVFPINHIF